MCVRQWDGVLKQMLACRCCEHCSQLPIFGSVAVAAAAAAAMCKLLDVSFVPNANFHNFR